MQLIINEFKKFSSSIKGYTDPVDKDDIIDFERIYSVSLPDDYKRLLSFSNGISLMGDEILGIGKNCLRTSLKSVYDIEHYEVGNPMPMFIIPFSPDGFGNHYCFDSLHGGIVFWQHDMPVEYNISNRVYKSLSEMIQEVFYDWTLEDYDYSGELKSKG